MGRRNGQKTESEGIMIKLPGLKWQFRILLYFFTLLSAGFSLAAVLFHPFHEMAAIAIYVVAGCGLALSCCYLFQDLRYGVKKIKPGIEANSYIRLVTSDYRYRTVLLRALVETFQELDIPKDIAREKLMQKFQLSLEAADDALAKY